MKIINKMQNENCIDEISFKYTRNEQEYVKKTLLHIFFQKFINCMESEILHTIENKDKQVTNINVPGRPIISQCNGPLERIRKISRLLLVSFSENPGDIHVRYW